MCTFSSDVSFGKDSVLVSAKTGSGVEELLFLIEDIIKRSKKEVKLLIPYTEQSLVSGIYNEYAVKNIDYIDNGILIETVLDDRGMGYYKKYILTYGDGSGKIHDY